MSTLIKPIHKNSQKEEEKKEEMIYIIKVFINRKFIFVYHFEIRGVMLT